MIIIFNYIKNCISYFYFFILLINIIVIYYLFLILILILILLLLFHLKQMLNYKREKAGAFNICCIILYRLLFLLNNFAINQFKSRVFEYK